MVSNPSLDGAVVVTVIGPMTDLWPAYFGLKRDNSQ